jgi:hypothetical protein
MIIVAVAAFTPCCTDDDCQDELTATSHQDHRNADDDGGGCSPFFACTGCPGFTLMEKPITLPAPAEYHPQYFIADFDYISSTYTTTPWQPPRTA